MSTPRIPAIRLEVRDLRLVATVAELGTLTGAGRRLFLTHSALSLKGMLARIPADIAVHTLYRRGKPGPEIVKAAKEGDYDAIILGARGVGRVGALMGSVSSHVLHNADIAVFVAHAPKEQRAE